MASKNNTRHALDFGENKHDGRMDESESPFVDALTNPDYNRANETEGLVLEGRMWVADYPTAWDAMLDYVQLCKENGWRIEWRNVCGAAKAKDHFSRSTGKPLSIDNNHEPLFMRWFLLLDPELAPLLRLKSCRYDEVEIGGPHGA